MMNMEQLNNILTIVSVIVTIISIACSILSYCSAKDAKQYKEETLQLRNTFDLERFLGRYQVEAKYFQNNTRKTDWYKGVDVNTIISPFTEILSEFGNVYNLMDNPEQLRCKVHSLNEIVQIYSSVNSDKKKEACALIIDITESLQHEVHRNKNKIVKS